MATNIMGYANRHTAPARYQIKGGTSSIPSTGIRSGKSISVSAPSAGGVPASKPGAPETSKVPTGGEPGEPTNIPEAYNPIIDAETENAPIDPNRQETIANQTRAPRFSIGNPNVGSIDLGSLLSAKPTEGFDPKAPIGGANVPFQETKGVGGYFRRLFGDTSNEQNVAAQAAQGAEWKQDTREQKAEDRALNRMREGDKPTQARFEATQTSNKESEANRVAAENKRIALEGERLGLTKQQIQDAKEARIADQQTERQKMLDRVTQDQAQNALQSEALAQRLSVANYPHVVPGEKGSYSVVDPTTGNPLGNFSSGGLGMIKDAKGNMVPGTTQGKWNPYVTPAKVPPNLGGGGTVDRGTGATMGGPLTTPTRSGISLGGALNEPAELPPGGGVRMGGALPAPMPQAAPAVVTQPRSATIADTLVNLPGMSGVLDMGHYMTPERTARLEESKRQQLADRLKRNQEMLDYNARDLGPSAF